MGKNVNPFSLRQDPFGFVDGPEYTIDKVISYVFYHVKCPKCGFYNETGKTYEICPECGENLILMKEENYETVN